MTNLTKQNFKPIPIFADTNSEISKHIATFEKDFDANPIVATFQSLSTAVPLIVANTIVMMNLPFRDHEYNQTVSRCWRLGQDTQVYVETVLLDTDDKPNISTRSNEIMEWSREQVAILMGKPILDDTVTMEGFDHSVAHYLDTNLFSSGIFTTQPVSMKWSDHQ